MYALCLALLSNSLPQADWDLPSGLSDCSTGTKKKKKKGDIIYLIYLIDKKNHCYLYYII